MPTRLHPQTAYQKRVRITVELERYDGHSSRWGQSDNFDTRFVPTKVLRPEVGSWVEERLDSICLGVSRRRLAAFMRVAEWASQPKIFLLITPALREGGDVFNLEPRHHQALRAQAVAAAVFSGVTHPSFQGFGQVAAHSVQRWDETALDRDFMSLRFAQ